MLEEPDVPYSWRSSMTEFLTYKKSIRLSFTFLGKQKVSRTVARNTLWESCTERKRFWRHLKSPERCCSILSDLQTIAVHTNSRFSVAPIFSNGRQEKGKGYGWASKNRNWGQAELARSFVKQEFFPRQRFWSFMFIRVSKARGCFQLCCQALPDVHHGRNKLEDRYAALNDFFAHNYNLPSFRPVIAVGSLAWRRHLRESPRVQGHRGVEAQMVKWNLSNWKRIWLSISNLMRQQARPRTKHRCNAKLSSFSRGYPMVPNERAQRRASHQCPAVIFPSENKTQLRWSARADQYITMYILPMFF